jgi:hypothetical protein
MSGCLGLLENKYYDLVPKDHFANLEYRKEMLLMAGRDDSVAAQLFTMCSEDPLFYINTFCWTYSPKDSVSGYPVTPFITYEFQDEAIMTILDCINKGNDAATPKSRDMGASWIGLTAIEWCWHYRDYLSFLVVSRKQDYVDDSGDPASLFWKIDFLHQNQPRWMLPKGRCTPNESGRRLMHLANEDNKSVIDGDSTTGNVGVGDRRTAVFIDEFAAFPTDDGYAVLRGTRDVTACRIFNSTPRGQNAFYDVCTKTSAKVIKMHWSRHPMKCDGMYQGNKETGEIKLFDKFKGAVEVFERGEKESRTVQFPKDYPFIVDGKIRSIWYDVQCARCASVTDIAQELDIDFLGSDYQFFDAALIEILKTKYCKPPVLVGDLEWNDITYEPKRFVENPKGKMELWCQLDGRGRLPSDRKFVVGSDVSAGTGASNSVTSIVDERTGEKVGVWRDSNTMPTQFAQVSVAIAKWFNKAKMIWDRSGPTGEVFTKTVVTHGYGNVYYRRNEKKFSRDLTNEPGYYLNPQAKAAVFEDYRDALSKHLFINRSEKGMSECLQFIRCQDGSIEHSMALTSQDPSGARTAHGDEVVADALASLARAEIFEQKEAEGPEMPVGCLAYRQQQKRIREENEKVDKLGSGW